MITSDLGKWVVQIGKGSGSYKTKWTFASDEPTRAAMHYEGLNTHSGHKKRLINPNGQVVRRTIT